jgi:hypothetical protein
MPRISREAAAAKQSFVRNLIQADSTVTNQTIQAKLKEQFGGLMNADTIKAIRAEVVTPGVNVVAQQTAVEQPDTDVRLTAEDVREGFVAAQATASVISVTKSPEETHLDGPMPDLTPKAETPSTEGAVTPEPVVAAEKAVEKVDPVITVMDLVTDERGSHIRTPTETEGKEVTLRPGLVEVVK